MKGTIIKCLEEMVSTKYGQERWKDVLAKCGMSPSTIFTTMAVVPDEDLLRLLEATAAVTGMTLDQARNAFGEFWSTTYAPSIYGAYFKKAKNARELLLNLDHIHVVMTKTAGASPPRFRYEWRGDRVLVMHYDSPRGLVALMPGLIRGVGRYFRENLTVAVKGNELHITFPVSP